MAGIETCRYLGMLMQTNCDNLQAYLDKPFAVTKALAC